MTTENLSQVWERVKNQPPLIQKGQNLKDIIPNLLENSCQLFWDERPKLPSLEITFENLSFLNEDKEAPRALMNLCNSIIDHLRLEKKSLPPFKYLILLLKIV